MGAVLPWSQGESCTVQSLGAPGPGTGPPSGEGVLAGVWCAWQRRRRVAWLGFACRLAQPSCSQHFGSQGVKCRITSLFSTGKAAPPLHPRLRTDMRGAPRPAAHAHSHGTRCACLPVLLHASCAELRKSILNRKAAPGQPCAPDKAATPNPPWRPGGAHILGSPCGGTLQELAAHLTGLALQVFFYEPNEECA